MVESEDIHGAGSEWTMWREAATKMGEDVLLAMVNGGTVETRRHKQCPESLGIAWPLYLEVNLSKETKTCNKRKLEQSVEDEALPEAEFEIDWKKGLASSSSGGMSAGITTAVPNVENNGEDLQKDIKAMLVMISKIHSSFDKVYREGLGVVSASSTNKNTKGSQIEEDLGELLKKAKACDNIMLQFETESATSPEKCDNMDDVRKAVAEVQDYLKKARRTMQALRSLWKL